MCIKKYLFFSFSILLLVAGNGYGQQSSRVDVIVGGGVTFPRSPESWTDNWKWGPGGGIGVAYRLSPRVTVDTHIDYYSFFFDDFNFSARLPLTPNARNIQARSSSIIGLSANIRYSVPASETVSSYLTSGLGIQRFYMSDIRWTEYTWDGFLVSDQTIQGSVSVGLFLIAGAGLSLRTSENRSYFIEIRYGMGFSDGEQNHFLPMRIGFIQRIR